MLLSKSDLDLENVITISISRTELSSFCLIELYLDGVFNFAPFVSKQTNKYRHLAVKIEMAQMDSLFSYQINTKTLVH